MAKVVILTGVGISVESGIPIFRRGNIDDTLFEKVYYEKATNAIDK